MLYHGLRRVHLEAGHVQSRASSVLTVPEHRRSGSAGRIPMHAPHAARVTLALYVALSCSPCSPSRAVDAPNRAPAPLTPLQLVLTPWPGEHELDQRIRELQSRIPHSVVPVAELERLGW